MKITKINRFTVGVALLATLAIGTFSSCLKDKNYERYDQSPALISFQYKGNSAEAFTASLLGTASDSFNIEVTLSVASLTKGTAVSATLSPYTQGLDSFNSASLAADSTATTYTQLPAASYTLANGGVVTINPGEQIVKYKISFAGDQIDFTQDYALALNLTNPSGATIASNLSTAIIILKLKNPYEGDYHATGYFVHPSAPRAIDQATTITTVTLITSQAFVGDGTFLFDFDTDPTTGVLSNWQAQEPFLSTYGPTGSGFLYTDNGANQATYPGPPFTSANYPNVYDFATQTFLMHYGYNGGPGKYTRDVYEKYERQ